MGAEQFVNISLGRTIEEAYSKAVTEALYWHGHGGYTGTIAEKGGFVYAGVVNSLHVDRLEEYFTMADSQRVSKIPPSIKPVIMAHLKTYHDKWGPAVAFEVTGKRKKEIKESMGRAGTRDKVFVFLGWASS